jgi:hypothetical protein
MRRNKVCELSILHFYLLLLLTYVIVLYLLQLRRKLKNHRSYLRRNQLMLLLNLQYYIWEENSCCSFALLLNILYLPMSNLHMPLYILWCSIWFTQWWCHHGLPRWCTVPPWCIGPKKCLLPVWQQWCLLWQCTVLRRAQWRPLKKKIIPHKSKGSQLVISFPIW